MTRQEQIEASIYSCPSCPVDERKPGVCEVCGRPLVRRTS